jgi:SAM-dependent methyltransferase
MTYPVKLLFADETIELACPSCKGPLSDTKRCEACQIEYRDQNGRTCLMDPAVADAIHRDVKADKENAFKNYFKRWPTFYQWCIRIVAPVLFTGLTAKQFVSRFKGKEILLNVGSGPTILHPRSVNIDVFPFPGVHLLSQAEALPFADATFDVVVSEEVMEHVRHPHLMAKEMQRVTKPGGLIYVSLPFMYPYHPSPDDYWRCTVSGLRALFDGCDVVESGVHSGPVSGMLSVLAGGLATIFSFGSRKLQQILSYPFMLVLSPFKLLDLYYAHTPAAEIVASGVYIVARTPLETPRVN